MNKRQNNTANQIGFTLVELVVTLGVIAITTSVAVPAFSDFISANRLTTQSNNLVTALNYSRSEAVKRSETVTVTSNNNTNWDDGWRVTAADASLLKQMDALPPGATLESNVSSLQYQANGTTNSATPITFTLCIDAAKPGRQITLSATGRAVLNRDFICP